MNIFRIVSTLVVVSNSVAAERSSGSFGTPLFGILRQQPLRGGAALLAHFDSLLEDDPELPPRISAQDMSLALRWTGEINRRLTEGTRPRDDPAQIEALYPTVRDSSMIRGGDIGMIPSTKIASVPPLTIFHAKSSRPTGNGANRWGPDVQAYIQHICRQLELPDEASVELSLALIYLDRASSAETPRTNRVASCPFLQPRTMHRLVLCALILATQSTRGIPLAVLMERVESLGIPSDQLAQMLQWMQGALGDLGYYVTKHQIETWRRVLQQSLWLRPAVAHDVENVHVDSATAPSPIPPVSTHDEKCLNLDAHYRGEIAPRLADTAA